MNINERTNESASILVSIGMFLFLYSCANIEKQKQPEYQSRTNVSIQGKDWMINGQITYPNSPTRGLLMNVRMVNATFEDQNKPEFDAEANTKKFIRWLPEYRKLGVSAITLNLQGGMPGYEGAINSAFQEDGNLRADYMKRIRWVIQACDQMGMVVILGCFYQRQDQVLEDEDAVRNAVENAVTWVNDNGFDNVVIEIANEFMHGGFDHEIISNPKRHLQLIRLAKKTAPNLLVSTSGMGNGRYPTTIAQEVDYILIHFNTTPVDDIPERIHAMKAYNKPIVCNEDDKTGEEAVRALKLSVRNGASWGYMNSEVNQYQPLEFQGFRDDPLMYDQLRRMTVGS